MQYQLIYLCLRPYPAAGAACDQQPGRALAGAALPPVQHGRRCSAAAGDLQPSAQPMVAGSVRLTRGCRSGPLLLVWPAGADPARGHGCRAAAGAGSLSVNAKQFSKCPK